MAPLIEKEWYEQRDALQKELGISRADANLCMKNLGGLTPRGFLDYCRRQGLDIDAVKLDDTLAKWRAHWPEMKYFFDDRDRFACENLALAVFHGERR